MKLLKESINNLNVYRAKVIDSKGIIELIPLHKNKGIRLDLTKLDQETFNSIKVEDHDKNWEFRYYWSNGDMTVNKWTSDQDAAEYRLFSAVHKIPGPDRGELINSRTGEVIKTYSEKDQK
jgi:hypothetical protein